MIEIPDDFIDDSIKFYFFNAIEELKKKKYKNQSDYRNLICDFFEIKLKLYNFAHQKIGLYPNSVELKSILDDSIEKHIVNDGLFWGIFILSIRLNEFPSFQLKAISESVNRFERCKSKQLLKQAAFGVAEVSDRILNDSIELVGIFSE